MALAQQLDELALANRRGLLNDNDYRRLRQNLFEQHSTSALVPVEPRILSVAGPGPTSSSHRVRVVDTHIESTASRTPSLRRKNSFTVNVTNLLKHGSGDKTSVSHLPDSPPTKRGLIPRLHKKASQLFSGHTGNKRLPTSAVNSSIGNPSSIDSSHTQHSSNTPLRSPKRTAIPTFPSTHLNMSSSSEIFDDRNLYTAKDIRAAIIATEAEAQRILEAFDGLESSTSFRVTQQNARRLRAPTPEHVTTVINGSNWRKYTPQSQLPERKVYYPVQTIIDNSSTRSISPSIRTSLSRSKSISSLRSKQNPTSPLSARFPASASSPPPSILRKNSMSSIASQARFGVTSTSLSRSSGHLPFRKLGGGECVTDADRPGAADTDSHPEVFEVQRRRDEVIARYSARLEYLQARLKSAELHERLLRR